MFTYQQVYNLFVDKWEQHFHTVFWNETFQTVWLVTQGNKEAISMLRKQKEIGVVTILFFLTEKKNSKVSNLIYYHYSCSFAIKISSNFRIASNFTAMKVKPQHNIYAQLWRFPERVPTNTDIKTTRKKNKYLPADPEF